MNTIDMFRTIIATLLLSACTFITGKGPVVEKELVFETIHGVQLDGSFDLEIEQGADQKVEVLAQENIAEKLKMNVLDGILYLSLEPGSYLNYELTVRIVVPKIESIGLSGSGDIKVGTFVGIQDLIVSLDGSGDVTSTGAFEVLNQAKIELDGSGDIDLNLKAAKIVADLRGSGDIDLKGRTSELLASVIGSGDLNAFTLESIQCTAVLEGSGDIRVFASHKLDAQLTGIGDIRYRGEPEVTAAIDGSGSVEPG